MPNEPSACQATADHGGSCRAKPKPGDAFCRYHSPNEADRAKHREDSRRGGISRAYGALVAVDALATDPAVAKLDLATAKGVKGLLASTLGALARLPFDVRCATAIGQIATAQRGLLEASDFEQRLAALESARAVERMADTRAKESTTWTTGARALLEEKKTSHPVQ